MQNKTCVGASCGPHTNQPTSQPTTPLAWFDWLTLLHATQQEYEEWNEAHGLSPHYRMNEEGDVWFDPRLAPAIVVPGWEIDAASSDYWEMDKMTGEKRYTVSPLKWDDILGHTQVGWLVSW